MTEQKIWNQYLISWWTEPKDKDVFTALDCVRGYLPDSVFSFVLHNVIDLLHFFCSYSSVLSKAAASSGKA